MKLSTLEKQVKSDLIKEAKEKAKVRIKERLLEIERLKQSLASAEEKYQKLLNGNLEY